MRISRVVGSFVAVFAIAFATVIPAQATDFTTYAFDSGRDGWNSNETILNPSNVPGIQQLMSPVALPKWPGQPGDVVVADAQPLYLSSENTPIGVTNMVYVATEENTILAYSPRARQTVWTHAYGGQPVEGVNTQCPGEASPRLGITSTPVIDTTTDTMYFVTDDWENGNAAFRLHAISPGDGNEKPYSAPNGVVIPVGQSNFTQNLYKQRPALTLANGMIYIAFGGAGCDYNRDRVWGQIYAYSASTLALNYGPYSPANPQLGRCGSGGSAQYLDSIWMSGNGPAADQYGNIWFTTGNGCLNYPYTFGQSLIRLSPSLTFPNGGANYDTQISNNAPSLNAADQDLGAGGVSIATNGEVVYGGKDGRTWITGSQPGGYLGGYCYNPCLRTQACSHQQTNGGIWGSQAVFQGPDGYTWIATGGQGSNGSTGMTIWYQWSCNPGGGAEIKRNSTNDMLYSGGTIPLITSNGTTSGTYVVWFVYRPRNGAGPVGLYAYNAETMAVLTTQPAGSWTEGRFAVLAPAVADGYVMLSTGGNLMIWTTPSNFSSVRPSSRRKP